MAGFELEVFKIYVYNKMTLLGFSNVSKLVYYVIIILVTRICILVFVQRCYDLLINYFVLLAQYALH